MRGIRLEESVPTQLGHDQLHLWMAPTPPPSDDGTAACRELMSMGERQGERRFRWDRDRLTYRWSRAVTRCVVSRYLAVPPTAVEFARTAAGKPEIATAGGSSLELSLAHTKGMTTVLLSHDRAVGVDVEPARRFDPGILPLSVLGEREAAALARLPADRRPARLLQHWVLKEAYAKARGRGLELPLARHEFTIDEPHPGPWLDPDAGSWSFSLPTAAPGFVIGVAAALRATDEAPPNLRVLSLGESALLER
jgi:4'-phosphopantetheinyl transferase